MTRNGRFLPCQRPATGFSTDRLGRRVCTLLLALYALLAACAPLRYVERHPAVPPAPPDAPPLTVYQPQPGDCPAYDWDDASGAFVAVPWERGGGTSTIPEGFGHPAAPMGIAACLHVIVPPGAWIEAVEGRDRYFLVRDQLQVWEDWAAAEVAASQQEQEALLALARDARKQQPGIFIVGAGAGALCVLVVVVAVAVGGG